MVRFLAFLFLALIAAFLFGLFVNGEPGYIMIRYQGRVIETSFVLFAALAVAAFVAAWIALRMLWWLLTIWPRYREWRAARRKALAERTLREGLMALAEGNWRRAENLLTSRRVADDAPVLRYLGAAQAAEAQQDASRRDTYLRRAHKALPEADLAVWLRQAEMHLKEGRWEQARSTIDHLRDKHPNNKEACRLARELYELTDDWRGMRALLPELKRQKLLDRSDESALERDLAVHALDEIDTATALEEQWSQLSSATRKDDAVFLAYARALVRCGKHDDAEPLIRKRLRQNWDDELVAVYGALDTAPKRRLDFVEGLLDSHPKDPVTLMTAADLALANESYEKARQWLVESIEQHAAPEAFLKLATVLEKLGDEEGALTAYRQGLSVAAR